MLHRPLLALLLSAAGVVHLAACSAEAPAPEDPSAEPDIPGEANTEEALTEPRNIRGLDKMNTKEIALTFDDGPRTESVAFAQWLKDQGVVATFFMTGTSIVSNETTRGAPAKIAAMGHLVANHTYSHPTDPSFAALTGPAMIDEIAKTDRLIASSIPAGVPSLLRTSGGSWSSTVSATLNGHASTKHYLGNIYWDIGGAMAEGFGADWACWSSAYRLTPAACGARYLKEIAARGNKGIVLLHDIHANTRTMVREVLVPELKRQGFTFVRADKIAGITPETPGTPTSPGTATAGATCADGCIWSSACVNRPHAPNAPANVPLVCVQRGNCSVRCSPR